MYNAVVTLLLQQRHELLSLGFIEAWVAQKIERIVQSYMCLEYLAVVSVVLCNISRRREIHTIT